MKISLKKTVDSCIVYLVAFFAIMRNYSMLSRDQAYGVSEQLMEMVLAVLCLFYVLFTILTGKTKIQKNKTYGILTVLIISLCSVTLHEEGAFGGILNYVFPMTAGAIFFAFQEEPEDFWRKFANIMAVMALVSLILYFAGSVLGWIAPTRRASYWYDNHYKYCNTYFGLQYEAQRAQIQIASEFEYRNCGFFIEAPMYNILLCFGFAAELSFQQTARKKVLVILGITIITTMTTTGVLFLAAMVAVYIFTLGRGNWVKSVRILLLPILALVAVFFMFSMMETKMGSATGENSVGVRVDHMLAFLKMFVDHPLLGTGYGSSDVFKMYTVYKQGYSVGLPALLGYGGIFLFLLYLVPWIRNVRYSFRYDKKQLYFGVGTFICLFLTAVIYHPIMYMTMAFQVMSNLQTRKVKQS